MSIKVMSTIWDQSSHEGSTLLLLLALADHASDDGVCWPGIPRLARKARKTERHIKRLLTKLEGSGELYIVRGAGRGNTNMYYIALDFSEEEMAHTLIKRFEFDPNRAAQVANYVANLQGKGDTQDTFLDARDNIKGDIQGQERVTPASEKVTPASRKGDIAMSPEPSLTINESSGESSLPPIGEKPDPCLSDKQLVRATADLFDELVPETPEEIDAALREAGYDPDEVGARMKAVAERAIVDQIIEQTKTHPGPEDLARKTIEKRAKAGGNYAVPPSAGGANSFADGPLDAFATYVAGISLALLPAKTRRSWAGKLRQIAEHWSTEENPITAEIMERAIRAVPDSDIGWKTYTSPYAGNFETDIGPLLLGGGQTKQGTRHSTSDPDKFARARAMTLERLGMR